MYYRVHVCFVPDAPVAENLQGSQIDSGYRPDIVFVLIESDIRDRNVIELFAVMCIFERKYFQVRCIKTFTLHTLVARPTRLVEQIDIAIARQKIRIFRVNPG